MARAQLNFAALGFLPLGKEGSNGLLPCENAQRLWLFAGVRHARIEGDTGLAAAQIHFDDGRNAPTVL